MKIKKEFFPFIIILSIICCLNIPVVLLMYFYAPNYIKYFANIVIPIQSILLGLSIMYPEFIERKKIKEKCFWT